MSASRPDAQTTITRDDIKQWLGDSVKIPSDVQLAEFAAFLNRRCTVANPQPPPYPVKILDGDGGRWWDFDAVQRASKVLRDSLPLMEDFFSQTLNGAENTETIKNLRQALEKARNLIDNPFGGDGERVKRRQTIKEWETYALLVARSATDMLTAAGNSNIALSRKSVLPRVVHNALIGMNIPGARLVTASAVAAFLAAWDKRYGLLPTTIAGRTKIESPNYSGPAA